MPDVLVLCYHAISDRWPSPLAVRPDDLERQLALLVGRGYRGATFERAVTSPPASRTLAVTFDDAYRSVLTRAVPILASFDVPGTVFAVTDFVGTEAPMSWPGISDWVGSPHEDELVGMSWDELRSLRDAGWEVGSHTCSHPHLSRLDERALRRELADSRNACEAELGTCRTLALPYGDGNRLVVRVAGEEGYDAVAGLPAPGLPRAGWPRVGVYPPDGPRRFRVKVARTVRLVREATRVARVDAVVRALRPSRRRAAPE